jgi:hypothetical protein
LQKEEEEETVTDGETHYDLSDEWERDWLSEAEEEESEDEEVQEEENEEKVRHFSLSPLSPARRSHLVLTAEALSQEGGNPSHFSSKRRRFLQRRRKFLLDHSHSSPQGRVACPRHSFLFVVRPRGGPSC